MGFMKSLPFNVVVYELGLNWLKSSFGLFVIVSSVRNNKDPFFSPEIALLVK